LERRSTIESGFTEVAAVPGIHISLSDSKTLKDAPITDGSIDDCDASQAGLNII
jgi:hypothetical protein